MLHWHVFGAMFSEFCGILRVFVNFAGFRGFDILRLLDHVNCQKPCKGLSHSLLVEILILSVTLCSMQMNI